MSNDSRTLGGGAGPRGGSPLPRQGECAGPSILRLGIEGPVSHGSGVRAAWRRIILWRRGVQGRRGATREGDADDHSH